jgi:hypothetical protein
MFYFVLIYFADSGLKKIFFKYDRFKIFKVGHRHLRSAGSQYSGGRILADLAW